MVVVTTKETDKQIIDKRHCEAQSHPLSHEASNETLRIVLGKLPLVVETLNVSIGEDDEVLKERSRLTRHSQPSSIVLANSLAACPLLVEVCGDFLGVPHRARHAASQFSAGAISGKARDSFTDRTKEVYIFRHKFCHLCIVKLATLHLFRNVGNLTFILLGVQQSRHTSCATVHHKFVEHSVLRIVHVKSSTVVACRQTYDLPYCRNPILLQATHILRVNRPFLHSCSFHGIEAVANQVAKNELGVSLGSHLRKEVIKIA